MSLKHSVRLTRWMFSSFVQKHKKALLFSVIIGIVLFLLLHFFLPYLTELQFGLPQRHIGMIGLYTKDSLPDEIRQQLSYGFVKNFTNGTFQLKAAQDLKISDNLKTYRIVLPKNLRWSDDKEVLSRDLPVDISGAEISYPSSREIVIKVAKPFSPLLHLLEKPLFRQDMTGLGPYRIRRITYEGERISRLNIYSTEEEITYRFYPNADALTQAFRLGEISRFVNTNGRLLDPSKDKAVVTPNVRTDTFLGLFFNTAHERYKEKTLRQALAYAIADKTMGQTPCLTSIRPDSFAFSDNVKQYQFDPAKAKEFSESMPKDKITLATTVDFLDDAEKVRQSWSETLGFPVEISIINTIPSDFEVLLLPLTTPLDPDQYYYWHSLAGQSNLPHLKNLKIDTLLEQGRAEFDLEERKEIYADFQKTLSEEVPVIFLHYLTEYTYSRPGD